MHRVIAFGFRVPLIWNARCLCCIHVRNPKIFARFEKFATPDHVCTIDRDRQRCGQWRFYSEEAIRFLFDRQRFLILVLYARSPQHASSNRVWIWSSTDLKCSVAQRINGVCAIDRDRQHRDRQHNGSASPLMLWWSSCIFYFVIFFIVISITWRLYWNFFKKFILWHLVIKPLTLLFYSFFLLSYLTFIFWVIG